MSKYVETECFMLVEDVTHLLIGNIGEGNGFLFNKIEQKSVKMEKNESV